MKNISLCLFLFLVFSKCFSQKEVIIKESEREFFTEKITEYLKIVPISEYKNTKQLMIINKEGLYEYVKDSSLVSAQIEISLYSAINDSLNPSLIGHLKGFIKEGKREGIWTKEIFNKKKNKFVVVKTFNYLNGVLNGKYQVFDLNGKILSPYLSNPFDVDEEKSYYEIYKNGSGYYYDYYYDTGVLKETGRYLKGKKNSRWIIYDSNGKVVKKESYYNGFLINN
ncbi:hypothetical protein [Aquimarina muelleri]|uniref:MORN repeat variant n=1 Tax=Aquimarina muelleri TaxID=279356 RepID=A0A918N341_9FLAO|nr:hypothetical protein [Aquimarina muelleri]MCX2761559.1 hypothetical protein [Aquimarina muelleri]GGX07858.1 hypothetical protein GCM10007384_07040 [Aquimarina muelleri]